MAQIKPVIDSSSSTSHLMSAKQPVLLTTPADKEIMITRSFAAPQAQVFDAFTRPELVRRWMNTSGWQLGVCEIDLQTGGAMRYVWCREDGREMGLSGEFQEINRPQRIVHTEVFDEDWTGGETQVTTTFEDSSGHTLMTMTIRYASQAARNAVLKSPMEEGIGENFNHLDKLLRSEE